MFSSARSPWSERIVIFQTVAQQHNSESWFAMLANLKSVAKALIGFLGVAIAVATQLLALGGIIPPTVSAWLSGFVAVATPIAAYFAPYAPSPKTIRRRSAAKKAAARKAQ